MSKGSGDILGIREQQCPGLSRELLSPSCLPACWMSSSVPGAFCLGGGGGFVYHPPEVQVSFDVEVQFRDPVDENRGGESVVRLHGGEAKESAAPVLHLQACDL